MSEARDLRNKAFWPVIGFLLAIAAWWLVARLGLVGATLLAPPEEVLTRLIAPLGSGADPDDNVYFHAFATLVRAIEGWTVGMVIGTLLALLITRIEIVYRIIEPLVEFVRAIPPILALPVLLVAFNYESGAHVATIVFGCAPIMLNSVAQGINSLDKERYERFALHQRSEKLRFFVRIMEVVPFVIYGARVTFSFAIIISVVTEMVFSPRGGFGIGALAKEAEIAFDTPTFYAAVFLMGLAGYAGNLLLLALQERYFPQQ
jgi:ABC-type nitrate/sulfonate/bicarbonate transport system permease component